MLMREHILCGELAGIISAGPGLLQPEVTETLYLEPIVLIAECQFF